jgi:hypothetical protein
MPAEDIAGDETGTTNVMPGVTGSQTGAKAETAFITSQLQQTNESYRMVITLVTQIMTVLVLGNITLVGYAISQHIAGILLIGPIFPIGIIATALITGRVVLPIIYTYVNLERKYANNTADWLGRTFFSFLVNPKFVERLFEIGSLPDWSERMNLLRKLPVVIVGTGKGIIRACLALVALAQVGAAFVLWGYFGWRMF